MTSVKISIGLLLFSITGFLFSKAHSKFAVAKAYYKAAGNVCTAIDNATAGLYFTTTGVAQAQLRDDAFNLVLLYSNSTCTSPVYFKPPRCPNI